MDQSPERLPGLRLTPEQLRSRRARSIAIGLCVAAFAVIFYVLTLVRLGPAAFQGTMQ